MYYLRQYAKHATLLKEFFMLQRICLKLRNNVRSDKKYYWTDSLPSYRRIQNLLSKRELYVTKAKHQ